MKISEFLKKDFIIPDLKATGKQGALNEICEYLTAKGIIDEKDTLCSSLMEREKLGSTGIGENVAIPHAKSESVDHIMCLFARSVPGIEFDSLDKKPVHFVCLLIAPPGSTGQHLKALARISRLLKSQDLRERILKAHDANQIYSVIQDEDSKFI